LTETPFWSVPSRLASMIVPSIPISRAT
jgi:hypothetical protein